MSNTKDFKTKSFRVDDDTFNRFKSLCSEYDNQGECFKAIISYFELNSAKNSIPTQQTNIADFQSHLDSILKGYLHCLELNQNAENRIRMEFQSLLDSKDTIIMELQNSNKELNSKLKDISNIQDSFSNEKDRLLSENTNLNQKIHSLNDLIDALQNEHNSIILQLKQEYSSTISDKESINNTLSEINLSLKDRVSSLEESLEENNSLKIQNEGLNALIDELKNTINSLENKATELNNQLEHNELSYKINISSLKNEHSTEINDIHTNYSQQILSIKQSNLDSIEKYLNQISQLQQENLILKNKINNTTSEN